MAGTLNITRYSLPMRLWRNRFAYLLILPTCIMMLLIYLVPMVQGVQMSLLDLNGAAKLRRFLGATYIGLDNYQNLLFNTTSAEVQTLMGAARNTVFYTIVVNIGTIGVGLLAALLLNRRFRGQKIARTLLLLPWIVPTYAVGMVWGAMWLRETGFVNQLLVGFGIVTEETRPFWLIGPNAFWAVVIPTIWRSLPFNIVMMLAGLQVIPEELFEAASMDGASAFQKLRFITLPLLRPVLSIMLLWGLIFTAFGYNIVVMMFGNGGGFPGEHADLLMPALSRQTFNKLNFGTGAAMSVMMMTVMMIVISGWLRAFRSTFSPEQVGV